jgi:ATP-dependent DNA ligase
VDDHRQLGKYADAFVLQIGTGFSDEALEKHAKFFKEHLISAPKSYYRFDPSLAPDHWFDTVQVWEVKCADLSLSANHKAALGKVRDAFLSVDVSSLVPPDHLSLERSRNIGPLISRWELDKFKNC